MVWQIIFYAFMTIGTLAFAVVVLFRVGAFRYMSIQKYIVVLVFVLIALVALGYNIVYLIQDLSG